MEGHNAGVLLAAGRLPRNLLVSDLLGELGVPLLLLARDGRDPVEMGLVELLDLVDAVHEGGELLELRPLGVGGRNGNVDLNGLFDGWHSYLLVRGLRGTSPPTFERQPQPRRSAASSTRSRLR